MGHEEGVAVKRVRIKERSGITLIDVLTVDPGNQDQLVKILAEATETTLRHMPGYISSVIHKSVDGRKVTSYEQWERLEDFEAMFQRPEVRQWGRPVGEIARADASLYTVEYVDSNVRTKATG